jgi:hypothetical protein
MTNRAAALRRKPEDPRQATFLELFFAPSRQVTAQPISRASTYCTAASAETGGRARPISSDKGTTTNAKGSAARSASSYSSENSPSTRPYVTRDSPYTTPINRKDSRSGRSHHSWLR